MIFHPSERLALFIDGNSLYGAARALEFEIDFKALQDLFSGNNVVARAFYFTTLTDSDEYQPLVKLVDWLEFNGFSVTTRMCKTYTGGDGRKHLKGSIAVDMAVCAMEFAPHFDHAVIASGQADFFPLIEALQRAGRRVTVLSTIKTTQPVCSEDLRRQCDQFIEIADIASRIKRHVKDRPNLTSLKVIP